MAPAPVGTPGTGVASVTNVVTPTTLTPGTGSGYAVGDLLLCFTACRSATPTVGTPTGWTSLANITGTNGRLALFGKIATSTSEAAPSVTWSGLTTGNSGTPCAAICAAFTRAKLEVDVTSTIANGAASTATSAGGSTVSTLNAVDLLLSLTTRLDDAFTTFTAPAGFTNVTAAFGTASGSDFAIGWAYKGLSATGSQTAPNFGLTGATSFASSGVQVAIKGGVVATIGQATETNTAQVATRAKSRAVSQSSETDTAQPVARVKSRTVGQATETDTAQPVDAYDPATMQAFRAAFDVDSIWKWLASNYAIASGKFGRFTGFFGEAQLKRQHTWAPDSYLYATVYPNPGAGSAYAGLNYADAVGTIEYVQFRSDGTAVAAVNGSDGTAFAYTKSDTVPFFIRFYRDASGTGVQIHTSTDGQTWTLRQSGTYYTGGQYGVDRSWWFQNQNGNFGVEEIGHRRVIVGQAIETDTAQAVTRAASAQIIAVGQASETDSATAVTRLKTKAIGQAVETDTAGVTPALRTRAIGLATETDTATVLGWSKVRSIGQATETDTGFAATPRRVASIGQAVETDTSTSVTASRRRAVGGTTESDTAQPVVALRTVAVGQASESDSATSPAALKTRSISQAVETDTARPVTVTGSTAISQAVETDTARPVVAVRTAAIGQASETDTAGAAVPVEAHLVGIAAETDTATVVTIRRTRAIGEATSSETANGVIPRRAVTIGQATETSTATAVSITTTAPLGIATETDSASQAQPLRTRAIGQATESDTAQAITVRRVIAIGQGVETESAQPVLYTRALTIGQALEQDEAMTLGLVSTVLIGQAMELDTAGGVLRLYGQSSSGTVSGSPLGRVLVRSHAGRSATLRPGTVIRE